MKNPQSHRATNFTGENSFMYNLVRSAILAANGHNTQPWRFAIRENAIEIHPDFSRQLPALTLSFATFPNEE
ncbi:MAG: hypothetical protein N3D16_03790 [Anaerolineales bacterium]|nr:hypothetical protein [Anaerolineales bacterium]